VRYTAPTVAYNIPELLRTRKAQDVLVVLIIVLVGAGSFGLGRLSGEQPIAPVTLRTPEPRTAEQPATPERQTAAAITSVPAPATGNYVASKSGSAYHLPWCPGAQRIKDENKIWFDTKEAAEAAGYHPASNCKGL
jgi:hypothetical protein